MRQILDRLHGTILWDKLEPYVDFFSETKLKGLQFRKQGRTLEEWTKEQPLYKEWLAKRDRVCDFKKETCEYLDGDVNCLVGLVGKMGRHMFETYKVDLRQKMTIGNLAEYNWQHALLQPIPKLRTDAEHKLWQKVNKGRFCGPLGRFDATAGPGQKVYKVDKTSLYSASSKMIEFKTEAGVQQPLSKWYRGFPDPTIDIFGQGGWKQKDYEGRNGS